MYPLLLLSLRSPEGVQVVPGPHGTTRFGM